MSGRSSKKRPQQQQLDYLADFDCFKMQQRVVDMLRQEVERLEAELSFLRAHAASLYKAFSTPTFPPGYKEGSWTVPACRTEQHSPQQEQLELSPNSRPHEADEGVRSPKQVVYKKKRKVVKTKMAPPPVSSPTPERYESPIQLSNSSETKTSSESLYTSSDSEAQDIKSKTNTVDTNEKHVELDVSCSEESSSDSDSSSEQHPAVSTAAGANKGQPRFPKVNWTNERSKKRALTSSDSDSGDSDDSKPTMEVVKPEIISQVNGKVKKVKLKKKAKLSTDNPEITSGSAEPNNAKTESTVPGSRSSKVGIEKLSSDASPEDVFDWNVLGLSGPWSEGIWLSSVPEPDLSRSEQLTSLPCIFGSCEEYVARFQCLILEECKAFITTSWENIQRKGEAGVNTGDVGSDIVENKVETHHWQLHSLHPSAGDPFYYIEGKIQEGRSCKLETSELVLLAFPKFPEIKVIASVNYPGDKKILLKTRVDVQPYGVQCVITRLSNIVTLKRQYAAICNTSKIWGPLLRQLLDPLKYSNVTIAPPSETCPDEAILLPSSVDTLWAWKEKGIFNNKQLLSMAALLQLKHGMLLVQGPPGTGKTSTIVGMISALLIEEPGTKILVCAASNAAVDEILSRLMYNMLDKSGKTYAPKLGTLVRVGVQHSIQVACQPVWLDTLLSRYSKASRLSAKTQTLDGASIVCSTLSGSGHPSFDELSKKFDVIFIDEGAQALECEALIALHRVRGRCVIVGDPCQLSATVLQRPGTAYGRSLFERIQDGGLPVFLLTTQYRMHPRISKYPSARFYRGCLKDSIETQSMGSIFRQDACNNGIYCNGYRFRLGSYYFLDVSWGAEEVESTGHSLSNVEEASVVATVVQGVARSLEDGRKANIGVITPYLAQRSTIMKLLEKSGIDESICEVNTVDGFQGREKDVIILSCVRALTERGLGFISDEKRMNVALTRAKYSLIIVGHGQTLKKQSPTWSALLEDASSRGCYQILGDYGQNQNAIPGMGNQHRKAKHSVDMQVPDWKSARMTDEQALPRNKPDVRRAASLPSLAELCSREVKKEPVNWEEINSEGDVGRPSISAAVDHLPFHGPPRKMRGAVNRTELRETLNSGRSNGGGKRKACPSGKRATRTDSRNEQLPSTEEVVKGVKNHVSKPDKQLHESNQVPRPLTFHTSRASAWYR